MTTDILYDIFSVEKLINLHELETSTTYRILKSDKNFGKENIDLSENTFTIRYDDTQKDAVPPIPYDGVPFIIRGKKTLECHQGKDRSKKKKERAQLLRNKETDHDYRKKRNHLQTTKKKNCPAMIRIRHVMKFTDFKLEDNTRYGRERLSAKIHNAIDKEDDVAVQHVYLISVPNTHQNHFTGEIGMLIQPLDERIKKYIRKMVAESNITSSTQMKLLLDVYIKNDLFKDQQLPSPINSRFWPTLKVIRNNILLGLLEIRNSNVDQKIVEQKVAEWKSQFPADEFFLRKKEEQESFEPTTPEAIPDADGEEFFNDEMATLYCGNREKFLYIHQTPWQRRLLARYGNEIALLDATYRTTKYALPLYFLCVPTNVNYITVASFVLETEDRNSIKEALNILKHWNPEWKPRYFMADYCDEEITALEDVFPGTMVYLCDFHREQSWERWLGTTHNGLINQKETALALFRAIARSSSEEEFESAIIKLEESDIWKNNSRLRNWFSKYWLNKAVRWVKVRRQDRFNVSINTNNGVERQNKSLKYEYLECRKSSSLSHLLSVIVDKFLPDSYKRYLQINAASSDQARAYAENIPAFLHNKPKNVVEFCFKRWREADEINHSNVDEISSGVFFVKSQTHQDKVYEVNINANHVGLPSCDCPDWRDNHLPCKHFFAVFNTQTACSWESLPEDYKNNPFINLDIGQFNNCLSAQPEDATDATEEDSNESHPHKSQQINISAIKRQRNLVGSACRQITDLAYHCQDMDVLRKLSTQLEVSLQLLKDNVPNSGLFVLEEGDMLHIGSTKAAKKLKNKYLQKKKLLKLPRRKMRKPAAGRRGQTAAMRRNQFTTKGAEELISENHGKDVTSKSKDKKHQADTISEEVQSECLMEDFSTACCNKESGHPDPVVQVEHFENTVRQRNMSINVVGYKINRRSFTDLDDMLPDEVMNAYISLKCKECQNGTVHFLSCEVMTSIFCGLTLDDPFPLHSFLEGVDIEEYDIIIGALHEAGCHWSLMVIFPKRLELIYLNPMGECREMKDIYLQKWLQFLSDRYIKGIGTYISEEWTISSRRHHKQMDSNSCGVFVLKFAELILKGVEDFRFNSTKKKLQTLRIEIGQYLVESSDNMQEVAITQEVGPSQHNDIDDVEDDYYEDDKDDRKMSVETCQVHYLTCKEKLYEIVNCQESTCDLADHVRHHEFVANPLKVQNRERVTVGFGLSVIKHRAMEYVHEKLSTDLLYNTGRDPKHPYTNRGTEMILGMKNGQLEKRFKVYRLGPQYLLHVLVKEMIVMIYMATHNSQYDKTNELCQETETNLTTECRKLKKQKINY